MAKHFLVPAIALVGILICSPVAHAQVRLPGARYDFDRKGEKPGPAPRRDLSGIWEPASGAQGGIQGKGAQAMDSCRRDKAIASAVPNPTPFFTTSVLLTTIMLSSD